MEVLITIVIFLIVIAAIFGVLRAGTILRETATERSEITANARAALNHVGKEAVNAGLGYSKVGGIVPDDFANNLLNTPADQDSTRDIFPGVIAGDEVSTSSLSVAGEKNDVVAFVFRDLAFNNGESILVTDSGFQAGNSFLTTPVDACASCRKWDLYLVQSANGNHALTIATDVTSNRFIEFADGDPLGLNRRTVGPPWERSVLKKCSPGETEGCFSYTPYATLKRIFITSYSVDSEGTLVKTIYGNNTGGSAADQIQVHPLAHGVQRFQVRYLMQDGTMKDDPSNGYEDQMKLNEVVQVEIKITIKSETNMNGVTSTEIINLDSTFSTRNLRYDFE